MSFQNETWLAIRTDVADGMGTGTPSDPFAANTPSSFADIMRDGVGANTLIRLGPGVFRTRGTGGNGYEMDPLLHAWSPKSGQRIIGAGMFSTTLQFVWDLDPTVNLNQVYNPGQRHFMIANFVDYLDSFELSDLTLDCNLQNALTPFGPTKDSGMITATTSGAGFRTVTASAGFFSSEMVGSSIAFATFEARITEYTSPTVVKISPGQQVTGVSFKVYGVRFAVTAASLIGENIRIRRVRVTNFGTRTPATFDGEGKPDRTYEGFPLFIAGRSGFVDGTNVGKAAFNSCIENCVIEQPYPGPGREVTFVVGGGVATWAVPPDKLHVEPFGCGIRDCYMNFDFVNPRPGNPIAVDTFQIDNTQQENVIVTTRFPHRLFKGDFVEFTGGGVSGWNNKLFRVSSIAGLPNWAERIFRLEVSSPPAAPSLPMSAFSNTPQTMPVSLSRSGSTVTVSTPQRHHRAAGDWIVINGADQPEYNGTFAVLGSGLTDTQFQFTISGTPASPAGDIWLDRRPNGLVRISAISVIDTANRVAQVTTQGPHFRRPGDWIMIDGIRHASAGGNNSYNNYVEVKEVVNRTVFKVELPGLKNVESQGIINLVYIPCFQTNYQATYVNGGFGGGVHRNRIASANRGCYHDFYWHRDLIVRKNYFHNVNHGVVFAATWTYAGSDPPPTPAFREATVQSVTAGSVVFIFDKPTADPGFVPGVVVHIADRSSGTVTADGYVTDTGWENNKFKVTVRTPSASLFSANNQIFCDLWFQQSLVLVEDNLFELALAPVGYVSIGPVGISTLSPWWSDASVDTNSFTLSQVKGLEDGWVVHKGILRDNIIRKVGNGADPIQPDVQTQSWGIRMNSCEELIVEGNIMAALNNPALPWNRVPHELAYSNSRAFKSFNNQWMTGKLRQLFNDPSWKGNLKGFVDELETNTEDIDWVWKNKPWF